MKRLLLSTVLAIAGIIPAMAADLPAKPPLKAALAPTYTGFYIGLTGGGGFANRQTDFITLPGMTTGDIWPAALLAGITTGYATSIGSAIVQLEADWNVSFNRQGGQCGVLQCDVQDSFLFDQGLWVGMPWSNITGATSSALSNLKLAAPSQWPIPINLPTSGWASTIMPKIGAGITERNVKVRETDPTGVMGEATDQAWLFGWWVGAGLEIPVASGWSVATEWKYRGFNKTFIPAGSVALFGPFAQAFSHLNEQSLMIKVKALF